MGLIKRSTDLVYSLRFIKLLTADWKDFEAYKLGIINEKGERIRTKKITTGAEKNSYTSFIRLAINIKRLIPSSRLASFASALYLMREEYNISPDKVLKKLNIDPLDFLAEDSKWFILEAGTISPGIYKLLYPSKMLNEIFVDVCKKNDKIRIINGNPIGNIFGLDIFEATHINTNKKLYITTAEIGKWVEQVFGVQTV